MPAPTVASSSVATGSLSTLAVTKPSGAVTGDMLIAIHTSDFGAFSAMTAPTGWSLIGSVDGSSGVATASGMRLKVWQADGAVASTTFGNDSAGVDSVIIIARITGQDAAATPVVVCATGGTTSSTSAINAPSLTPAGSTDLLLCGATAEPPTTSTTGVGWTDPAGMTNVNSGQSHGWTALDVTSLALTSSAATGTKAFTPTVLTSWVWSSVSIAVKAVSSGTNYTKTVGDSLGATDTLPLVPPSHVTATATSASAVTVAWDMVPNVNSYDVERDGSVISTAQAGHTYSDTGLAAGTTYTYNVRSVRTTSGS